MMVCITARDGRTRRERLFAAICTGRKMPKQDGAGDGTQLPQGAAGMSPRGSVSPAGALGWAVRSCGPSVTARAKVPFIERERE